MQILFIVVETPQGPRAYFKVGSTLSPELTSVDEAVDMLTMLVEYEGIPQSSAVSLFQAINQSPLSEYAKQDPLKIMANPLSESELLFIALHTILREMAEYHDPSLN